MDEPPVTLVTGTRVGRYEVLSKIGAGGMGEVFLAEDKTLDRKVALKVLPADVATDHDRIRRFSQEARAASALNHPNILTIHEIGQAGKIPFIATEFVEGVTLRDCLARREPLPLSETLDIAVQVASALAAAHAAGIVHRDIKPGNVMRRKDGLVKVLDFGLATLTTFTDAATDPNAETQQGRSHTEPGRIMGTLAYMSPEQARGAAVDARTDIFSFGILLYEMIAGCLPFGGSSSSDVTAAIVSDKQPPPLARYARDVPAELERIVEKALRKDRDERYQVVADMLLDLKSLKQRREVEAHLARSTSSATREGEAPTLLPGPAARRGNAIARHKRAAAVAVAALTIAALSLFSYINRAPALTEKDTILLTDFTNTTGDSVFDGTLKQALAVTLGQSPFLNLFADDRVRETMRLMNHSPDERVTPAIGREICQRRGLKAMLTGSIASLGRNYMITLEAVDAQTGDALAREQGEAQGKEQVIRILGETASRLRGKLGESLRSIKKFDTKLAQATTSSLEALKAYSLGIDQNRHGKYSEAISSHEHAVELDPTFAMAYTSLAMNYRNVGQSGLAAEAAQEAFKLQDRVSERERLRILYSYYVNVTGELHKAIEALELLTQIYPRDESPDNRSPHNSLALRYSSIGQFEKAVDEYREALRLNPTSGLSLSNLSGVFLRLDRYEQAKAMGEQAIAQKFDSPALRGRLFEMAFISGDRATMQQQVDWANARPGEYYQLGWQSTAAAFAGRWREMREFSNRAAQLAHQRKLEEDAGYFTASRADWSAVVGLCQQSRADLIRAAPFPRTTDFVAVAAVALALCGEAAQAQAQDDEAVKQYPKDTTVNEIYLPLARAAMAIHRGSRTQAIQMLRAVSRYESVTFFYSNYLRGQAWLGEKNGAEAAREFQTILDHRGWDPTSPLYPLAHLGLARATALTGDTAKSSKAYQDFLALWKDADADLPVLIAAKKEYEKIR